MVKRYFIEADGHIIEIDFDKYTSFLKTTAIPIKSFSETIEDFVESNQYNSNPIGFKWIEATTDKSLLWNQITSWWEEEW